jgi:uncharacterized protein (TIGR02147 family)
MEPKPSIFDYRHHAEYLWDVGRHRNRRLHRPLSHAQWARQLGYRSPRGIAMVLSGQRLPSADMLHRLSTYLSHSEAEHRYLEMLVEKERHVQEGRDTEPLEAQLWKINPKADATQEMSLEDFAQMGQWFFYVIKQLIDTQGFQEDYGWIQRRLRGKVSPVEIRGALRVLTQLGIVRRGKDGRLRTTGASISVPHDIKSTALREHHRGLAARAVEALEEQAPAEREFDSLTLRVSPEALPKVKEAIRHFVNQFDKSFENLDSDRVYQLNVQFFEHTTQPKEGMTP